MRSTVIASTTVTLPSLVDEQRLDQPQIRMRAGGHVQAAGTNAARISVGARGFAQQCARKVQGERALAQAAPAGDQQRLRPSRPLLQHRGREIAMPRQQGCDGSATARVASIRSSMAGDDRGEIGAARRPCGRVLSMTRKRVGSAAARVRYAARTRSKNPGCWRSNLSNGRPSASRSRPTSTGTSNSSVRSGGSRRRINCSSARCVRRETPWPPPW